MATPQQIAATLDQLHDELLRRVDEAEKDGTVSPGMAESLAGIGEGMQSIVEALWDCNGRESDTGILGPHQMRKLAGRMGRPHAAGTPAEQVRGVMGPAPAGIEDKPAEAEVERPRRGSRAAG